MRHEETILSSLLTSSLLGETAPEAGRAAEGIERQLAAEAVIYGMQRWKRFFEEADPMLHSGLSFCHLEGSFFQLVTIKNDPMVGMC